MLRHFRKVPTSSRWTSKKTFSLDDFATWTHIAQFCWVVEPGGGANQIESRAHARQMWLFSAHR